GKLAGFAFYSLLLLVGLALSWKSRVIAGSVLILVGVVGSVFANLFADNLAIAFLAMLCHFLFVITGFFIATNDANLVRKVAVRAWIPIGLRCITFVVGLLGLVTVSTGSVLQTVLPVTMPTLPCQMGLWLAACLLTSTLAIVIARSGFDWFVLAAILPFLPALVLPFLGKGTIRANSDGGILRRFFSIPPQSSKRCSKCGMSVPSHSRAGEHCPGCGTYWWTEQRTMARNDRTKRR
ncbi:MAG: hypothetical protein AB7V46_22875, partial [Thermomicrobiales bacterium]